MMIKKVDDIINTLSKESKPYQWVMQKFSDLEELKGLKLDLQTLELMGLKLALNKNNSLSLQTRNNLIKNEIFCIVDIESTGGIKSGEILEIGAVKLQNNKEISRFESLIKVEEIPEKITELTGINLEMVQNAPSLKKVLADFRLFLQDSVFVAHNVRFDYGFISKALNNCNFGILLNRRICSVEFAQTCIQSPKYNLSTLKELLGINNTHHRALSDALAATEIFKYCLSKLPFYIQTTEELIRFSKTAKIKQEETQTNLFDNVSC
ncbi:3'-5' exonuclease [Campylobacter sp. LR264d]|nr:MULTISPECIES: 3'-5' exonuclease [unclassified Campylobacter]KAA6226973.1 3'-5' exonuclease [Campylobacter sp. LR185c]KAA6234551.1 3'-5' exonuclease [Campylobacter sp. LR264d]KAA8604059.1 DNA polymerase III subunit epsilon [Campylobacter sp. LR185c]